MTDGAKTPPLQLKVPDGLGPYLLPKCIAANFRPSGSNHAELELSTTSGQRILIPVTSAVVETLHGLMDVALKSAQGR
jgi:hypothetical protein